VSNPNVEHATALTLTFSKFKDGKLVIYPRMETMCELAAQFKLDSNEEESSALYLASLNLNGITSFYHS